MSDIRHQLSVHIPNLADEQDEIARIYALNEARRKRLAALQEKLKAVQELRGTTDQIRAAEAEISRLMTQDTTNPLLNRTAPVTKR
jgi:hypothetical protein